MTFDPDATTCGTRCRHASVQFFKPLWGVCGSGDVFIDAGANIGIYTVLGSRLVGPGGRVICIEMMPNTADRLEHHIRVNKLENVTVIRKALSNVSGHTVRATIEEGKFGAASIARVAEANLSKGSSIEVETIRLDDVAKDLPRIRLLKMDLEGAEQTALEGAKGMLSRVEAIIYESRQMYGSDENLIELTLVDAGFKVSKIDENNCLASRKSK